MLFPITVLATGFCTIPEAKASGWESLSFEAMHEFKLFDIESGLPFLAI